MTYPDFTKPIPKGPPTIYAPAPWIEGAPPVIPTGPPASVHEVPSSRGFAFRLAPGVTAAQILPNNASFRSRFITFYAPGVGSFVPNLLSVFFGYAGTVGIATPNSAEIPPGAAGTIDVDDVNKIWFIAQNAADVITGWVEADL